MNTIPLIVFVGVLLVVLSMTFALPNKASTDDQYDPESGLPADTPLETLDFNKYRFHDVKKRYFKVGEVNGCGENMRFFAVPGDERRGQCDCDWFQCSRPLMFDKNSEKCHWAWSRGPCESGEWYTYGKGMLPICQKHPCPEHLITEGSGGANFFFQNPQDSRCYEAGTQGYCKTAEERLWIYPNEPIPICRNATVCYPLSIPAQQLCIQGSRWHQDKTSECSF